jgi:hypothetical protein
VVSGTTGRGGGFRSDDDRTGDPRSLRQGLAPREGHALSALRSCRSSSGVWASANRIVSGMMPKTLNETTGRGGGFRSDDDRTGDPRSLRQGLAPREGHAVRELVSQQQRRLGQREQDRQRHDAEDLERDPEIGGLLSIVLDSVFDLDEEGWRKLTFRWGLFFFVLAALNEP